MRRWNFVQFGFRIIPAVRADQCVGVFNTVLVCRAFQCKNLAPRIGGSDRFACAYQRRCKTTLQVDPFRVRGSGSLKVAHGLVRVGDRQHDVVEVRLVDDVDVLERFFQFGIGYIAVATGG